MIKYRINGEFLDLFNNKKDFAVTKQVSKIGEINLRHGDFSTSFKVPLTANNARILRYVPELNHYTSEGSFDRFEGALIEDDAIISDGFFQIVNFSPTSKEVTIKFFGGNTDWFDLLKDRYINIPVPATESIYPYDLSDFQHAFTSGSIAGSWDFSKPYYYFLKDSGKNSYASRANNFYSTQDFAIGFLEKSLFNRIFDSVGIKTQGSLFNEVSFDKTIVSSTTDFEDIFEDVNDRNTTTSIIPLVNYITHESAGTWTSVRFDTGDLNTQWNGTTFRAANAIGDLRFNINISIDAPASVTGVKVRVLKNGTPTDYTMTLDIDASTRQLSLQVVETNVLVNDAFEFQFAFVGNIQSTAWIKGQQFSKFRITEKFIAPVVDAEKVIPKIKQTDFIKDIMIRYGVVSFYDVKSKTLTLNKFEDVDKNRSSAPDWTDKIDLSKGVDVDFTKLLSKYAKRSLFEYQDDTEADSMASIQKAIFGYNEGTGILNIENDFLSDEESVYESPYAPTINRLSLPYGDNARWIVPFLPTQKATGNNEYEKQELKPRLLYASTLKVSDINNFTITQIEIDADTIQHDNVGYAYFFKARLDNPGTQGLNDLDVSIAYGNLSNDNFVGESLLERNYNLYNKVLNAPFYVSLYMNLSSLDVQQYNPFIPIFLKYQYDSGYYYIDSIEQYKGDGSTTKVNLIKI